MDQRTRAHRRVVIAAVAAVCALGLATAWYVLSDSGVARRAHGEAVERWEAHQPEAYSFDLRSCSGMCADCPIRVTVVRGQVTAVDGVGSAGCEVPEPADAPTVEALFDLEAGSRSAGSTDSFTITYDPVLGFPASASFRCPDGWSDCGSGFTVSDFEVLSDAP